MAACVFCDIAAGHSPASIVYRDDACVAVLDICPVNPGHTLVIPVRHATYLADLDPEDGRALFAIAQKVSQAIRRSGLKAHLHVLPRFNGDGFGHTFSADYGRHPPREELDANAQVIRNAFETA